MRANCVQITPAVVQNGVKFIAEKNEPSTPTLWLCESHRVPDETNQKKSLRSFNIYNVYSLWDIELLVEAVICRIKQTRFLFFVQDSETLAAHTQKVERKKSRNIMSITMASIDHKKLVEPEGSNYVRQTFT